MSFICESPSKMLGIAPDKYWSSFFGDDDDGGIYLGGIRLYLHH